MEMDFLSRLPFLAALQRQTGTASLQDDDDGSNPIPGQISATPPQAASPDSKGQLLIQLLQSGLAGGAGNPAGTALNPLMQTSGNTAGTGQANGPDFRADPTVSLSALMQAQFQPQSAAGAVGDDAFDPASADDEDSEEAASANPTFDSSEEPQELAQLQQPRPQQAQQPPPLGQPQSPPPGQLQPPRPGQRQPPGPGQPQQGGRLTADEQQEAAATAYSESTRGTVAEHEAVISVILNRAESGQRQYVNHGQDVTVDNVIHADNQFQGVPDRNDHRNRGNYQHFQNGVNDQGAQNARTAAANVAQNGPTTNATAFLVTNGRQPRAGEVQALGNVHAVGRVGNVFLYAPGPAPAVRGR